MTPESIEEFKRVRSEFRACWRQRYVVLPAEKWLERVEAIEREAEPCEAMILHQALRKDMEYLENGIINAASELDAWIQSEIDRARGK